MPKLLPAETDCEQIQGARRSSASVRLLPPLLPGLMGYLMLSLGDHASQGYALLLLWGIPVLLWLGVSLIFPRPYSLALFTVGVMADFLFNLANQYKISLNVMPITAMDIYIIANNPNTLWQITTIPIWSGWLFVSILLICLTILATRLIRSLRPPSLTGATTICATLALTITTSTVYSKRLEDNIKTAVKDLDMRGAKSLGALSQTIGSIPFLIYSSELERTMSNAFFQSEPATEDIPAPYLANSYKQKIKLTDSRKPNMVLLHLESIFNPDAAFELDRKVSSVLFEKNHYTKLIAPMRVNIIGGGTWVSEFEVLTGLDHRLFGYKGYYTHVSVGPFIEKALPAFLKSYNYTTSSLFPIKGVFYNTRSAFLRYGFDHFWDAADLGFANNWTPPDTDMAHEWVKKTYGFNFTSPFFSYIVTNGAHSPYPCMHFPPGSAFPVNFKSSNDVQMNCELNEYLLLLQNAETAVRLVLERLRAIEDETGRPFVLMVYGDHQPYAFTVQWDMVSKNYDPVRTSAPKNQTFMHVMSSTTTTLAGFEDELPITLAPTILSGFVAANAADAYLPSNLYLFEKCGSNLFPELTAAPKLAASTASGAPTGLELVPRPLDSSQISRACKEAQEQTIATQRKLGIVSNKMQ